MTAASRARFAHVVRTEPVDVGLACLLIGAEVEPGYDVGEGLAALDVLAEQVPSPAAGQPPAQVAATLRAVLASYAGAPQAYDDVRSSMLHEVLRRGSGLPILLSVLWTEVAARRGIACYPVALPGHVVVGVGDPDGEHVHVDPFGGGRPLTDADLERLVQGATGGPLRAAHLRPLPAHGLLLRLLTNVRVLTTRLPPSLDAARMRLWAVELSLLLPRHPVELRREHGELLVRLGDHAGGAQVLEQYATVVEGEDADGAETARSEARQARARLN